ncbi:EAL domain-containing protein [Cellulomonas endophytica]|uniref:EAL domain-containing protein n=1 Tax=Cellulomonas endophytica TaxID=2494735 RepID=UPI001F0C34A2|nr:EAL domain-containing protein [Cellulomonas endophytica]
MSIVEGRPVARRTHRLRVPVGRQPIWTTDGVLHGHEYLYRSVHGTSSRVDGWPAPHQDDATASVLAAVLRHLRAGAADGPVRAFVNVTRSYVTGALPLPVLRDGRLVLEVVESVAGDPAVLAGLRRLHAAGHRIALDDFTATADQRAMLPFASYVKIDARDLDRFGDGIVTAARDSDAVLVAEWVHDRPTIQRCVDLGFTMLQGNALGSAQTARL